MNVQITMLDGALHITPATDYLTKYLKYSHKKMEIVHFKRKPVYEERLLHQTDGLGGIFTLQGFFQKICNLIHKNNDTYTIVDERTALPDIDWQAVKDVGLRDYQIDAVAKGLTAGADQSGIFHAAGGYGKTYCQAFTYAAWNSLNTILAIPLAQVFRSTYEKFKKIFPNKHIGRVGDGYNDISKEITITTFRSLEKCAVEKCQLLLVDELQGSSGDHIQNVISSVKPIRIFGFTATDDGLFNGADKLLKGLFGERLIHIPYEEAQEVGAVVPALVYFVRTPQYLVTASSFEACITQGVKKCKPRNELISKIVTKIPKGWPSLTFVDHIDDHLIELHKLMPPGVKYVHRKTSKKEIGVYALSTKQQKEVTQDFIDNKFQHLIATDAFRAGVDIPHLRVVIQASSGSSKIEVIQEALRGSRVLTEADKLRLDIEEDKTHFVLIDFLDNHDERLNDLALKRMEHYKAQGWKIKIVDSVDQIDWYDYDNKL
jgi:superfamily II DNA or RNA helicase